MASKAQRIPLRVSSLAAGFIVLWLIIAAFPFAWTLWGSLKVEGDFFSYAGWWDAVLGKATLAQTGRPFTLGAYRGVWVEEEFWRAALHPAHGSSLLTASICTGRKRARSSKTCFSRPSVRNLACAW